MSDTKEFLFDVKLSGAVRVCAKTPAAAAAWLKENLDYISARVGYEDSGREVKMEVSLADHSNAVQLAMDDDATRVNCLDTFTRHYLVAALWSSRDDDYEDDVNLDANYELSECAPTLIEQAREDCLRFQMEHADDLAVAYEEYAEKGNVYHPDAGSPEACAGHDFWLTRAGHGTGFWDRGLSVGTTLTEAAKKYREINLYAHMGMVYSE